MTDKILLYLLILYGIWSQGITGTFADKHINVSSDFLVRQKRVVSDVSSEDVPVRIIDAPYVVQIKQHNRMTCTGSILSKYAAITSAACSSQRPEYYQVVSNTGRLGEGRFQVVLEIRRRFDNPRRQRLDGVALLIVAPTFTYTSYCQPIQLHTDLLLPGIIGEIHGWGYNIRSRNRGTDHSLNLRSIQVPIISHRDCVNRYRPHLEISDTNICTYHQQRHSGHTDFGAGLVVNGSLAGVFLWSGLIGQIDPRYPEVFALLQDSYYRQWIKTNVENITLHYENLHHH